MCILARQTLQVNFGNRFQHPFCAQHSGGVYCTAWWERSPPHSAAGTFHAPLYPPEQALHITSQTLGLAINDRGTSWSQAFS